MGFHMWATMSLVQAVLNDQGELKLSFETYTPGNLDNITVYVRKEQLAMIDAALRGSDIKETVEENEK